MAAITSKQISFSPGGRIIHICSRLRNPGSLLRATCSLQGRMQSKRLKYHHGAHFPDEKTEVKGFDQGHTAKYVKCQNTPRISSVQWLSHVRIFVTPWITACQACPSPTPGVRSNSRSSSWWCHPAISSSAVRFSSCPQPLPASGSFPMSQLST